MSIETDARIAETLDRLLARLDALERKVDQLAARTLSEDAVGVLDTFAGRVPTIADAAGSGAAYAWQQAEAAGIDPIAAGMATVGLVTTLGKPAHIEAAGRLAEKAMGQTELVEKALDAAPRLGKALDRLDLLEKVLDASGDVDPAALETVVRQGGKMLGRIAKILSSPEFQRLVDTADASTFDVATQATGALVATRANPPQPVGPFGALKAMNDPDVRKAVGFTLAVAKRFGQTL